MLAPRRRRARRRRARRARPARSGARRRGHHRPRLLPVDPRTRARVRGCGRRRVPRHRGRRCPRSTARPTRSRSTTRPAATGSRPATIEGLDPSAPSPEWLTKRLQLCGVRAISLAVDVTNYVMLETGQPLHAFDRAKLSGPIGVRRAQPGEKLTTLDDQVRTLDPADLVVTDDTGAVALAGVMGGASTEIGADTSAVVFEAAHWDPGSIAHTSRRHKLSERGVAALRARCRPGDRRRRAATLRRPARRVRRRPCSRWLHRRRYAAVATADRDERDPAGRDGRDADRARDSRRHARGGRLCRRGRRSAAGPPADVASRPAVARRPRRGGRAAGRLRADPVRAAAAARRPRAYRRPGAAPRGVTCRSARTA